MDILKYNEKKKLLELYLNRDFLKEEKSAEGSREETLFYDNVEKYFNDKKIEHNDNLYFILRNDDDIVYKFKLLKLDNETNNIIEIKMIAGVLKKIKTNFEINISNINNFFGFLSKFKSSNRYVFKIKRLTSIKNNIGRKCGGNKSELIKIVNFLYSAYFKIIGEDQEIDQKRYFKSDESSKYNKVNNFDNNIENIMKINPINLCIEIEILFRYFWTIPGGHMQSFSG